jgi:hypothetical protein
MKKLLITLLFVALIAAIAYIILLKNGHDLDSIVNTPKTIDISVQCPKVENMLLTSLVNVTVVNNSNRIHNNVTVRLTAYDEKNNIIKQKEVKFDRILDPNGSLSKPVTLPVKAKTCDCVVESSDRN